MNFKQLNKQFSYLPPNTAKIFNIYSIITKKGHMTTTAEFFSHKVHQGDTLELTCNTAPADLKQQKYQLDSRAASNLPVARDIGIKCQQNQCLTFISFNILCMVSTTYNFFQ